MSVRALALGVALVLQQPAFAQQDAPDPRDAQIDELKRRVEALERERAATAAPANTVEPEEAARALERTLSREGALVLPKGSYEIEPRLEYTHGGTRGLDIATLNGIAPGVREDVKKDRLGGRADRKGGG